MTAPRLVQPGATYLNTRRCANREYLLTPSERTNDIVRFALAHASSTTGIQLHTYLVMSDHLHLEFTDPHGKLPVFNQMMNSLVGRQMNIELGRTEAFWKSGSYSAVALKDRAKIVDRAAYTLANPVKAGLVPLSELWPGLRSDLEAIGKGGVVVERPEGFFREDGDVPKTAVLELVPPPGFTADEFREQVKAATAALEAEYQEERRRRGREFLGRRRILRESPTKRATTPEPQRTLNPHVAASDDETRIAAVEALKAFRKRYREAWILWCKGKRDTLFPAGTYLLRVLHGALCEQPGVLCAKPA